MKTVKKIVLLLLLIVSISNIAYAENTSILAAKLSFEDFSFASSTFVTDGTVLFNTTPIIANFSFMSSFNIVKTAGGGISIVTGRVTVDSEIILEEELRTIDGINDEGVSGFSPVLFQLAGGEHNLSLEFRRTGPGTIEINDIDFIGFRMGTVNDTAIRVQVTQYNFTHTSTDFEDAFNWTMNKILNSSTFIGFKQTSSKETGGSSILTYFTKDQMIGDVSPFLQRELESISDIGSMAMGTIDLDEIGIHNHSISARQTDAGDTISVSGSVLDFDMIDELNNTVPRFQTSNNATNTTETLSFSEGIHNIVNITINISNGSSYFLSASVSLSSTSGGQNPSIFVNSTDAPESVCRSKKERTMSGTGDIANLYIFTLCGNITIGELNTFNVFLNVSTGETVDLLDESLAGFETTSFRLEQLIIPPTDDELLVACLRDGECDGWFIKERLESFLLLSVFFIIFIIALICDEKEDHTEISMHE